MHAFFPLIILVNPQMGENIGASARAMRNFGLKTLRLVNPRDGWPNPKAEEMSAKALSDMPPVQVFDTLQAATADLHHLYATTARSRDIIKPVFTPKAACAESFSRLQTGQKIGFVFGAERTGLTNDEVALCQSLVHIPCDPAFSSLNLAQAVLLMAYEHFQCAHETPDKTLDFGKALPAEQDKLEEFLVRLETELEAGGFFRAPELRPTVMGNIRALFLRSEPTAQEIKTLHGVVTALGQKKNK